MIDSTKPEVDQALAATVLVALVQEDAPQVTWRLDRRGHLESLVVGDTDQEKRRGLAAWQRVIGAGPVTVLGTSGMRSTITIRGSYEGIPVEVSAVVAADLAPCCQGCQEHAGGVA